MIEKLEAQAAMNADHVFAITKEVKEVLTRNGVDDKKITILPNAVDLNHFSPIERNKMIEKKLDLRKKITIGYIGSFTDYEGLDYLLRASVNLKEKYNEKFKVILVGDGTSYDDLRKLRKKLKLEDVVHFTGRIDHNDVLDYYSVIDIAVYPRKGTPVCEIVSPLKPLEAMAMGKAVITSDVSALAEMVIDKETGLLHSKDDIEDLTQKIELLLTEPKTREELGERAKEWVRKNRTWDETSEIVNEVYHRLIKQRM
jgi:glycosyltransferase involved in cell wall biosynthesis